MAKLVIDGQEYPLADGAAIAGICQAAGIPFSCNTGVCGSCLIRVVDGAENLSSLTPEEENLGLDLTRRLACQCCIQKGTVRIAY